MGAFHDGVVPIDHAHRCGAAPALNLRRRAGRVARRVIRRLKRRTLVLRPEAGTQIRHFKTHGRAFGDHLGRYCAIQPGPTESGRSVHTTPGRGRRTDNAYPSPPRHAPVRSGRFTGPSRRRDGYTAGCGASFDAEAQHNIHAGPDREDGQSLARRDAGGRGFVKHGE